MTAGTPPNTPTLPSGDHPADHPRSPTPSEVTSSAAVTDIFAAFEDAYSPSAPAIIYEGDWSDFLDFSLVCIALTRSMLLALNLIPVQLPEDPTQDVALTNSAFVEPSLELSVNFDACAEALTSERTMSDGIIDFGTDEWTSFFGSEGFLSWYDAELSKGVRLGPYPSRWTLTLSPVDRPSTPASTPIPSTTSLPRLTPTPSAPACSNPTQGRRSMCAVLSSPSPRATIPIPPAWPTTAKTPTSGRSIQPAFRSTSTMTSPTETTTANSSDPTRVCLPAPMYLELTSIRLA